MKRWGGQPDLHFDEKELNTNLGKDNFIFVGSSCDMFAREIPNKWIYETLHRCSLFDNKYLFQSKNPMRFLEMKSHLPENVILGTTIESDIRHSEMGNAPDVIHRTVAIGVLKSFDFKAIVTIEPVMDFTVDRLWNLIDMCKPDWVNIGANTNTKVKLPEPSPEKVMELIERLKEITEVKIKPNLKRLLKQREIAGKVVKMPEFDGKIWNQYPK